MAKSAVVTGVSRYSLGEAFVRVYTTRAPDARVITIDKAINPAFTEITNIQQIAVDLNPLRCPGGLRSFEAMLSEKLSSKIKESKSEGVGYLIHCAGVYDFGTFLEHDVIRRERVLGLNVLGTTEVLHAVMSTNAKLQVRSDVELTYVLVGSFQGLHARGRRPLYAPSKAYGIDFCMSLFDGKELAKCTYIATGPIDTPMLHRNHWVTKARGSEKFFIKVLNSPSEQYQSIFIECDAAALEETAGTEFTGELEDIRASMVLYKELRGRAFSGDMGVLAPQVCAAALLDIATSLGSESGLYMLSRDSGGSAAINFAPFSSFDRRRAFKPLDPS